MKKMKTPGGLGALLLLMALIATGCLEQPGSDWVDTQAKERPVVIIDGTGDPQEVSERDVRIPQPARIVTQPQKPSTTSTQKVVRKEGMSDLGIYITLYTDNTAALTSVDMSDAEMVAEAESSSAFDNFDLAPQGGWVLATPKN